MILSFSVKIAMPIVGKGVLYRSGDGQVVTFNTITLSFFKLWVYILC